MSLIKKTVIINGREVEHVIAESELALEIQDFDDFLSKRDKVTPISAHLMTNSDVTW